MSSTVITLETPIPSDVYSTLKAQGVLREKLVAESKRWLALAFFREHILSLGQAARLSGLDYWSFTEFLSVNDVPIIDLDDEELLEEFSAVDRISQQLKGDNMVMSGLKIVVSDTTPLIALAKIERLHLLADLFGEIFLPQAVYDEVTIFGKGRSGAQEIAEANWITVSEVQEKSKVDYLLTQIDLGEAESDCSC